MRELIKSFLDEGLSRRGLIQKLGALGIGLAQAQGLLQAFQDSEDAGKGLAVPGSSTLKGTGGELVMAQAQAAGRNISSLTRGRLNRVSSMHRSLPAFHSSWGCMKVSQFLSRMVTTVRA